MKSPTDINAQIDIEIHCRSTINPSTVNLSADICFVSAFNSDYASRWKSVFRIASHELDPCIEALRIAFLIGQVIPKVFVLTRSPGTYEQCSFFTDQV